LGYGDNNPFNAFFDAADSVSKTLVVIKNVLGGGYIMNTVEHINFSCTFNQTSGQYETQPEHEVWTTFKDGLSVLFAVLIIFMLVYLVTGRGFSITS
jgi:hypothetical protein